VTWDVDSHDPSQCARLRRFIYGDSSIHGGKTYRYSGFVEQPGVQYLGQSVLFMPEAKLRVLLRFLAAQGIGHLVRHGSLGPPSAV